MEPAPTPTVGTREPHPLLIGVVLAAVIILLIGISFWLLDAPQGKKGSALVAQGSPTEKLYELSSNGELKAFNKNVDGTLEDYARGGSTEAFITRLSTGAFEVYVDGGSTQLTSDGARKSSIAVSDDGAWIAYAVLTNLDPEHTGSLAAWTVEVISKETGEKTTAGAGYAPQFFVYNGETKLFFVSPDGLGLFTLSDKSSLVDFYKLPGAVATVPVMEKNGERFALMDEETGLYNVYQLLELDGFVIHKVREIKEQLTSVSFVGDTLVGLSGYPGTTLYVYDLTIPESEPMTHTLPQSQLPYRLLP